MSTTPSFMPKGLLKAHRRAHGFLRIQVSSKDHEPSTSAAKSPPPANSLPGLPAEIKQAVLASLPDIASLKALMLICSSFYHAFHDCESLILAKILQNQITPGVLPHALATFESSKEAPWSRERSESLIMLYNTGQTPSLLPKWTLRNAMVLSEMHDHVRFFAKRFACSALSHHPVTGVPETNPRPISPSEFSRIEGTLYRFQFYCNLFALRMRGCGDYVETYMTSFLSFAPWENEQLACIHDYLIEAVSKSFNDVVEPSSIQRLARKARFSKVWSKHNPAYYIPLGLCFLHRFLLANTHGECSRLLSHKSLYRENFFSAPLAASFHQSALRHISLESYTEEEVRVLIPQLSAQDDDSGPRDAWRWAHAQCGWRNWYITKERDDLRERGYVMWDSARLVEWGILERDWRTLPRPREEQRYWDRIEREERDAVDVDNMPRRYPR